jgi:hypothetical protein
LLQFCSSFQALAVAIHSFPFLHSVAPKCVVNALIALGSAPLLHTLNFHVSLYTCNCVGYCVCGALCPPFPLCLGSVLAHISHSFNNLQCPQDILYYVTCVTLLIKVDETHTHLVCTVIILYVFVFACLSLESVMQAKM